MRIIPLCVGLAILGTIVLILNIKAVASVVFSLRVSGQPSTSEMAAFSRLTTACVAMVMAIACFGIVVSCLKGLRFFRAVGAMELSDALLVLGYYWQDYDCLRRVLRARNGGAAARLGEPSSEPTEMHTGLSGPDPNSFGGPTRAGSSPGQRPRTARARAARRGGVAVARSRGGRVGIVRGRPASRSVRTPRAQTQAASRRPTTGW